MILGENGMVSKTEIEMALSDERFGAYLSYCVHNHDRACALYLWDMAVGSAFLPWLNITEIILRNQIHHVLCMVHGTQWPWSDGFERTLPTKGFNPREILQKARNKHRQSLETGKVVADLSFAFWQHLLTKKYVAPLWNKHLYHAFPNLDKNISVTDNLSRIYSQIEQIRALRNRIAHHEPVY